MWSHRWLSRASRLVLVKSVLEAIPVYWMSLSWIPKVTLGRAVDRAISSQGIFRQLLNIKISDQNANFDNTNLWQHSWLSGPRLNLTEDMGVHWYPYFESLQNAHISLSELVWDFDPSCYYSPKVGYIHLSADVFNREVK